MDVGGLPASVVDVFGVPLVDLPFPSVTFFAFFLAGEVLVSETERLAMWWLISASGESSWVLMEVVAAGRSPVASSMSSSTSSWVGVVALSIIGIAASASAGTSMLVRVG